MTLDTLALLAKQNTRTVWLLQSGDTVQSVPEGTPGSIGFQLARVPARDVRSDLLYSALGRDGFVAYANWYNAQGQRVLEQAQAGSRKPTDPEPFDDTLPDDATWRAHSVALEAAVETELLTRGMLQPTYQDARDVLGLYGPALVRELVEWTRETPEDPNSPSASSEPP